MRLFLSATALLPVFAIAEAQQPSAAEVRESFLNTATSNRSSGIPNGTDITAELQAALDTQHRSGQAIRLPAGDYFISKTIRSPFRYGWQLHGAGTTRPPETHIKHRGRGTVLIWDGPEGEPMFELTGSEGEFGHLTLLGSNPYKQDAPRASAGVVVTMPNYRAIGVGKIRFAPLWVESCQYAVQCGESEGMLGCDNLYFHWLEVRKCEAAYRGMNLMGMDIVINHLRNYGCDVGVLMSGGGHLHVRSSLTTHPNSTMLHILDSQGVAKNNGRYRFSQTKIDAQASPTFQFVKSENRGQVRIWVDGGIHGNGDKFKGTFAELRGRNSLRVDAFDSSFGTIKGRKVREWSPSVLLNGCRIWTGKPENIFAGDLKARVRDCDDWKGDFHEDLDWPIAKTAQD